VDPAWSKRSFRGKIYTEMKKVLTPDDLVHLSEEEIYQVIVDALAVNSDAINEVNKRKFKGKQVKGLNNIIYHCNQCGHDGLEVKKNQLICPTCQHTRTYDYYGLLDGRTIHDTYYDQKQLFKSELNQDPSFSLKSNVILESYQD